MDPYRIVIPQGHIREIIASRAPRYFNIFESILNSQVNVLVGLDMSIPRGAIYGLVSQPFANTRVPLGYSWRHYLPDKGP